MYERRLTSTPDSALIRLADEYRSQPMIRALMQLLPGAQAFDAALVAQLERIRHDRVWEFFDELGRGETDLTDDLIRSEDFLQAFFSTTRAALNTRRHEKIRWFARLLLGALGDEAAISLETEYEDYLKILDELSHRELGLLVTLAEFEARDADAPSNDLNRAMSFWNEFESVACSRLDLRRSEVGPLLTRTSRTGAYEPFTGTAFNYTGGKGKLTPFYHRLAKVIRLRGEEFATMDSRHMDSRHKEE